MKIEAAGIPLKLAISKEPPSLSYEVPDEVPVANI
jgi:hypothetical protein